MIQYRAKSLIHESGGRCPASYRSQCEVEISLRTRVGSIYKTAMVFSAGDRNRTMSSLRPLLRQYRDSARSEREKGNYFERLAVDFIKNDHGMAQEYEDAWLFSEWAAAHGMSGIPLEAYDYVVNGKPALEWVMERQCVKTDKASGIVNDANRYAIETVGDPAYPLRLFQRVLTVSLETMKIVKALPPLGDLP
jgi:predicted helicase